MDNKINWIKEATRRFMTGFHFPDYDQVPDYKDLQKKYNAPGILVNVDPKGFVKQLKDANVQVFWFYNKCHKGNAYYPSKVGHVHSAIKGRDIFGETCEACLSEGIIPACVYEFSDHRMPMDHPEWCHKIPVKTTNVDMTDADQGARVSGPCLNGPYGDFVIEQTMETIRNYPIKGYYIDFLGLFGFEDWICPFCSEILKNDLGIDFHGVDKLNHDEYVAYTRWHYNQNDIYAKKLVKMLKEERPDIAFTHNFHGNSSDVNMQRPDFAAENCDFVGGDLFHLRAGMLPISWKIREYANISRNLPSDCLLDAMTAYKDFNTAKALDSYRAELWTCRSLNVATTASICPDIDGKTDTHIVALVKKIYSEQMQYEPWLQDMKRVCDVALIRSRNTLEFRPKLDPLDTSAQQKTSCSGL